MKVNKQELLYALEKVRPGLTGKEIIQQSNSFIFYKNRVYSYNENILISYPIKNLNFNGSIKGKELYEILNKFSEKTINISKLKNTLIINNKNIETGFFLQEKIDSNIHNLQKIDNWKKLSKNFIKGLQICNLAANKNNILPYIHINNKNIEATNGYIIASYKLKNKLFNIPILLSSTIISNIINNTFNKIAYTKNNWLHFKNKEGLKISCKIYNDKFPKINNILLFKGEKIILPKNLCPTLERIIIFCKSDLQKEELMTFKINKNKIILSSKTEIGWIKEEIKIENINNLNISFQINPNYLLNILQNIENISCIYKENKIKFENKKYSIAIAIQKKE